jgi:hypothetical protein
MYLIILNVLWYNLYTRIYLFVDLHKDKKYYTVGTILKILHCWNNSKNTTLLEQFQKYYYSGIYLHNNKWLTKFFKRRGRFSVISHRRAKPWDERWLRNVLEFKKNIFNYFIAILYNVTQISAILSVCHWWNTWAPTGKRILFRVARMVLRRV